ncbi:MAG: hypothetical protein JWM43_947 [Acidobacteriaceae bacterium]|nr:hypothetical protein [Acidobacteriaceae bacterium]
MIDKLLQRFIPTANEHLSDDRLASLFCNELPLVEKLVAKRHLAKCWHCRVRQGDLEGPRADRIVELYREVLNSEDLKMSPQPRAEFAHRLERHIQLPPRRWRVVRLLKVSFIRLPPLNMSFVIFGVCVVATSSLLMFWWQQRAPDISANSLLVQAEKWDSSTPAESQGVVYQSVRITAPQLTVERSIYRDLQGKRSLKQMKLVSTQQKLKDELARAGINWNEPMSASDYQEWHDHQHVRADKIERAGKHLLRLTTTTPDGSASPQSITVRDEDFHPVLRTVALRDVGTVEIAELDYKVLPWSAVSEDVFESIGNFAGSTRASGATVLHLPKMIQGATPQQLDEAELGARLILNQLHADSGEQIEIRRDKDNVQVEGIVETDERKRQLQAQLRMVPHVVASVQSVADLKNSFASAGPTTVQTASMPDLPSPLEISLHAHGRSVGDINSLAQRFFNVALTISQESKAIADLQTRFAPEEQRTIVVAATLSELIYSHRERLEAALKNERALLVEARVTTVQSSSFGRRTSSLTDAADKNLALSRELTQTNSPVTRSADLIIEEMSISLGDLAAAANDVYRKSPSDSTLSGKK